MSGSTEKAFADLPDQELIWVNFNAPEDFPNRYFRNASEVFLEDANFSGLRTTCDPSNLGKVGGCPISPSTQLVADLIAPSCDGPEQQFCISSIAVTSANSVTSLSPANSLQGPTVPGNKALGLPSGGTAGLWTGTSSIGTELNFMVTPRIEMFYSRSSRKFVASEFSLEILPYVKISNPEALWLPNSNTPGVPGSHRNHLGTYFVPSGCENAIWISDGQCGISAVHDPNNTFTLDVHLPKSLTGWFQANLSRPEITIAQRKSHQRLRVSAGPGDYSVVTESAIPRAEIAANQGLSYVGKGSTISGYGLDQYFEYGITWAVALAKQLNDVPTTIRYGWRLESMAASNRSQNVFSTDTGLLKACSASNKGVVGIVNTNAMAADPTPPKLKNGELTYQLADFHYMPDGKTERLGRYFMAIRDDFARCIYNSQTIPVRAKISIVGDNKATSISRKISGWHQLAVDGFTYSKKTIKVSFSKKK